ncbi:MAG: GNAT family N-acetyltransferase [Bryobacteraceae bacterium]|jgi:ribosomal protein S18 acetylase RimI-like enzyme
MGAQYHPAELVDLRRLSARHLEPLLIEETAVWRDDLEWDFTRSADLVRRYVDMRALSGAAVMEDGVAAGYVYFVLEENKGLIGDLFVSRRARGGMELENALFDRALVDIAAHPAIGRVESQLMMLRGERGWPAPAAGHLLSCERNFMRIELARAGLQEGRVRAPCYFDNWSDHYLDASAQLIAAAYDGHIDGSINDQYRSPAGARRFLHSVVQYPGCGAFSSPASCAAFEAAGGTLCGISLASLVAPECGHITQICVSPEVRGKGLGYALLRRSLLALRNMGCRSASLTVTAANQEAVTLYERVGFHTVRTFQALVWEGFQPRRAA